MKENRYYVYLHKLASTGEVFYVGKGQRSRLTNTDRRNTTWNAIVSEKEWFAEKYMDNLSSDEAAALEVKLIAELAPVANFHKKDVRPRALNKADFDAVIPEISGTAYIAGFCNWVLDARDPLKNGFLVR